MVYMIAIGRLTRDPEYTPKNGDRSQYAKFTIASDNTYGDLTTFIDCIVFGKQADIVDKYLSKGRQVAARGPYEQGEPYTDKNGNQRRSSSLKVDRVEFLGSRNDGAPKDSVAETFENVEEDVPF